MTWQWTVVFASAIWALAIVLVVETVWGKGERG